MFNKLRFYLEPKHYPYPDEPHGFTSKWGRLSIVILDNGVETALFETQWELLPLIKWINENENSIRTEELIRNEIDLYKLPDESLAQAMNRLQKREFEDEDESAEDVWYDTLYKFRERHVLWFGMRGSKIPNIFIGLNNGIGEISLNSSGDEWSYQFDMSDFFENFHKTAADFVEGMNVLV
jgi:hypothetical protein